jgi:uncharacterized protein (TIGR02594 family)
MTKQRDAYDRAKRLVGLREIKGTRHEPDVVQFFADVGHDWVKDDETAWCAAFVGAMLERSGLSSTRKLNAKSYLEWGEDVPIDEAQEGDICVFWRGSPDAATGHVAFYVSHGSSQVMVLGGNQSDSVSIAPYDRRRLLSVRRWPEEPEQPQGLLATVIAAILALFRR